MLATPEFWVLASFVGFIAVVIYYRAPARIAEVLDARAARIKGELDEAQRLREEAQGLLAEYQRKRRDAEKEAEDIVEQARREADRLKAEARDQMQDMIVRREKLAELKIAQAEEQALTDVRTAAAEAAVAAAERILADKVTGRTATELVKSSIEQVKTRLQ